MKWCGWTQCFLALAAAALATMIRLPVQPYMGEVSPFFFYVPVVVALAAFTGPRPCLLAIAASIALADYLWMPPEHRFSINRVEAVQITSFAIFGAGVSWLAWVFHRQNRLRERLCSTLAAAGDAIISTDRAGRIVYLNAMAEVLLELNREHGVGRPMADTLSLLSETTHCPLNTALHMALTQDEMEPLPRRAIIVSRSGKQHCVEPKISRIVDARGRKLGAVVLFHT